MLETILEALPQLTLDELRQLNSSVVDQIKAARSVANAVAIRSLRPGMTATLKIKETHYLNGAAVIIESIKRTKAVVSIHGKKYNVPASCLDVS